MKIKLTESQLQEMIGASIMEAFEHNPELQEGWLGNMFRAGAQTISNKVGKAYNDFAGRVNTLNAKEQGDKANALQQELDGMSGQIEQQVRQYRRQLMSDVNTKVAEYARKLKADVQKKQDKLTGIKNKQQQYQDKATANQQRYDQLHQQTSGRNMNEEEMLQDMISEAVRNVLKK